MQAPLDSQISNPGVTQSGQSPELLQPVAYSPNYSPQFDTDAYQASSYERTNTITQPHAGQQPSLPPRMPPPLPPKLPQPYSDNRRPDEETTHEHTPYYTQLESRHSETSLDQELRQYQQYSGRLDQLIDSSAASIVSNDQQKVDNWRNAYQGESHSNPPLPHFEDSQNQPNQHNKGALAIPTATDKGNYSDPPPYDGNHETAHISSPPLGNYPPHNLRQQGASVVILEHTVVSPKSLDLSTVSKPQDKRPSDQSLMQQQSTPVTKPNGNGRQSADSPRHSTRSHGSSASISDSGNRPTSGDNKPLNPIIDRFNSKISSPSIDQRYSESLRMSPTTTQTTIANYSSSALGFGGPSDWEHFGDYDAEEVDDTALYSRSEPKIPAHTTVDAAELPVETSPIDEPEPSAQQSLGKGVPIPQNKEPGSPSRSLQSASPLKSTKVLESPMAEHTIPCQEPSLSESPSKDEHPTPGQPSPPSQNQPITKLESTMNSEGPIDNGTDVSFVPSDIMPTISSSKSSEDRTSHPKKSTQVLQTTNTDTTMQGLTNNPIQSQAYQHPVSTSTESAKDEPAGSNEKPNASSRKSENETSRPSVGTVNQAELVPLPKYFPVQREISGDATKPVLNDSSAPIVFPTVSRDEFQPAKNTLASDGDTPLLTAKEIAMPMTTSNPGHSQIKSNFQDRGKQFRKNSQQFQEKLKRFQPTSDRPRESSTVSQKRPNQPQEVLSPHQGRSERSEEKSEELKPERLQGKQLQSRSEQYQQQTEYSEPEQNKQEESLGEFEQPQLAQSFKPSAQPIEDSPKQNRSQEELEQPKLEQTFLSKSNQSEQLPRRPSVRQPKLGKSQSEQPALEQPELGQPKLEQAKLEQPQPEQSKLEQPKLEQPKLEQPNLKQLELVQPNLEQPKLEQPKLDQPKQERHTILQQIMLEYPWAKQPKREEIKQVTNTDSEHSNEKLENRPENTQLPQKAPVNQSQEISVKFSEGSELSRDSSEHHKVEQHQEALTEKSREQFTKPDEGQEQLQERTWLDLSGSNDTEQTSSPVEFPPENSDNTAIFETVAEVPSQFNNLDKSNEQTTARKSPIPQNISLESLRETINPQAERDNTSHTKNTDRADKGADTELTPPSRKLSQDDLQKSSVHEPTISVPNNDDGVGAIYSDLDPWGRASLKRYISMLHEEVKAKTDKEKLNIFTVFINRESKLRAVLYGADDGPTPTQQNGPPPIQQIVPSPIQQNGPSPIQQNEPSPIQQNLVKNSPQHLAQTLTKPSQKALPALPPNETTQRPLAIGDPSENTVKLPTSQIVSKSDPVDSHDKFYQDQSSHLKKAMKTDSPVDETEYSPGGRPIVPREQNFDDKPKNSSTKLKSQREKVNKVLTQFTHYMYPSTSPSLDAPTVVSSGDTLEPPKPGYKPLKNNERESEPIEYLSKRQSAYRPYAALTMGSLDSGLITTQESTFKQGNAFEKPTTTNPDEPRHVNQNIEKKERPPQIVIAGVRNQVDTSSSPDLRRFVKSDFDSLVSVLPSSATIRQESTELRDMKNSMDAVPDDFSFIHQSVVAWDAIAKKEREAHERARHARQGESERKVDELFNEHEIGYADISELELEFKRSEAAKKADEDRLEYQTFLSSVFDLVWTRLHREIDELTPLYDEYTTIINDTLVGKDMFDESATSFALAPTMSYLLALHQKIEVRHQKAFEAVLERDRRLKKTEVSPWYAIGNVTKVKQLEKQFESAERNAIVEYCAQRDTRANKLMDVLDQNTLRGVGANQDYMECLMNGVRRVASGRAFASMPSSESSLGLKEVMKAKSITTSLASSSEQIVQTFHVADMLLNAADYEVSVAKSKLGNADAETFKQLKEERSKEDQKLMRDLEHRLALIREDSRRTHDEIVKLMLFLGIQNGHAETQQPAPGTIDPAHEERIQRALQEAKRRNESEEAKERNVSNELV